LFEYYGAAAACVYPKFTADVILPYLSPFVKDFYVYSFKDFLIFFHISQKSSRCVFVLGICEFISCPLDSGGLFWYNICQVIRDAFSALPMFVF